MMSYPTFELKSKTKCKGRATERNKPADSLALSKCLSPFLSRAETLFLVAAGHS